MEPDKKKRPHTEDDPVRSHAPEERAYEQDEDELEHIPGDFEGSVADDEELFNEDEDDEQDETKDITV